MDSPNRRSITDLSDSISNLVGSSSCSSSHCCSNSISREEADDGCLDDCEDFADALNTNENQHHSLSDSPVKFDCGGGSTIPDLGDKDSATDLSRTKSSRSRVNCHAWKPHDASFLHTLPNLSNQQHVLLMNSEFQITAMHMV